MGDGNSRKFSRGFCVSAIHPEHPGKWHAWTEEVDYERPPAGGESREAAKQRADRHRDREKRMLLELDYRVAVCREVDDVKDTRLIRHLAKKQKYMADRRGRAGEGNESEDSESGGESEREEENVAQVGAGDTPESAESDSE